MEPETLCRYLTWSVDFVCAISPASFLAFVGWYIGR